MRYNSIFDEDEGTPRKSFTQRDRMAVWDKQFGPDKDRAKCPICKRNEISRTHFAMGHKKALANGGSNTIRNIKPICHSCNSMMSTMNMSDFIKRFSPKNEPGKTKTGTKKTTKKTRKKSTTTKQKTKSATTKRKTPQSSPEFGVIDFTPRSFTPKTFRF
jgi:hypothetical protein